MMGWWASKCMGGSGRERVAGGDFRAGGGGVEEFFKVAPDGGVGGVDPASRGPGWSGGLENAMRRNRPFAVLSAACCLALAGGGLLASSSLAAGSVAGTLIPAEEPFDLEFGGGTLGEYLEAVSRASGANIVAGEAVNELRMPGVQLRGVSAFSAVSLVEAMFRDATGTRVAAESIQPSATGRATAPGQAPEEEQTSGIFVVRVMEIARRPGGNVVNDVFSIGDVLRPANEEPTEAQVKQIFEMIESAMTLSPGLGEPELAYHDQTQMLVFKGSSEQRQMVEAVLARYAQTWRPASSRAEVLRRELAETGLRAETLAIEARAAHERLNAAVQSLERATQLSERGMVGEAEMQEARTRLVELESRAQILELETRHARSRMEELRASLAAVTQGAAASVVVYDIRDLGDRGQRFAVALRQLAEVVGDTRTQVRATEPERTLVLQAGPTLHEAVRTMLEQMRASAERGGR